MCRGIVIPICSPIKASDAVASWEFLPTSSAMCFVPSDAAFTPSAVLLESSKGHPEVDIHFAYRCARHNRTSSQKFMWAAHLTANGPFVFAVRHHASPAIFKMSAKDLSKHLPHPESTNACRGTRCGPCYPVEDSPAAILLTAEIAGQEIDRLFRL